MHDSILNITAGVLKNPRESPRVWDDRPTHLPAAHTGDSEQRGSGSRRWSWLLFRFSHPAAAKEQGCAKKHHITACLIDVRRNEKIWTCKHRTKDSKAVSLNTDFKKKQSIVPGSENENLVAEYIRSEASRTFFFYRWLETGPLLAIWSYCMSLSHLSLRHRSLEVYVAPFKSAVLD